MKTEEQIRVLARAILNGCAEDEPAMTRVHTALCKALSSQQASVSVGVMSLLWTALNQLKTTLDLNDVGEAERVLVALLRGPKHPTVAPVNTDPGHLDGREGS